MFTRFEFCNLRPIYRAFCKISPIHWRGPLYSEVSRFKSVIAISFHYCLTSASLASDFAPPTNELPNPTEVEISRCRRMAPSPTPRARAGAEQGRFDPVSGVHRRVRVGFVPPIGIRTRNADTALSGERRSACVAVAPGAESARRLLLREPAQGADGAPRTLWAPG